MKTRALWMCIVIVLFKYVSDFWDMSGSELGEWHQSGQSQLVTLFRGRQLTVTSVIMAELITNQHCLHTIELGNSALLTPRTLYVGWLFKMDFPSMFFSFCGPLSESKLLWRVSRWSLTWDVTLRSSYLRSCSCLLIEHYFRLPLLKTFTRLSFALVN